MIFHCIIEDLMIIYLQTFFHTLSFCCRNVNRTIVVLSKTFGNDFSIAFVCFNTLITTLLKHC